MTRFSRDAYKELKILPSQEHLSLQLVATLCIVSITVATSVRVCVAMPCWWLSCLRGLHQFRICRMYRVVYFMIVSEFRGASTYVDQYAQDLIHLSVLFLAHAPSVHH